MLSPDDRKLYSQIFATPDGYVFDQALGTTYSLDLESLLFAQFCIASGGQGEPEAALRDPVGLLEAIHRTAGRVSLFCHAGATSSPSQPHSVYALLEDSVVPALGRGRKGIFHPKLWVLRFTQRGSGQTLLRVVVLSRNLTTSRAWDSFLCVEGEPERGRQAASQELAELLRALPELALHPLSAERAAALESLAAEVHRTAFAAPAPFRGVAQFRAIGITKDRGFRPDVSGQRLLAISPFVSKEALEVLRSLAPHRSDELNPAMLIGRPEEMARCPREIVEAWDSFSVDDAASSQADTAGSDSEDNTAEAAPQGLHAKAFAVQRGSKTIWWIGSANLTKPVQDGTSIELMVRLEGATSRVGIDTFLGRGFLDLLVPYRYAPLPPDAQEGSRSAVEKAQALLVGTEWKLRCEADGNRWFLILTGAPLLPEGVQVSCRPATLPAVDAVQLAVGPGEWRFAATVEALTALVVFELSAGKGEAGFELRFTLKLPLEGLPEERDQSITRSIIKDRSAFLNYLRCLLGGVGDDVFSGALNVTQRDGHSPDGNTSIFAAGLLEQLLRALHHEPERLRSLQALLERTQVQDSDAPEDVVTAEFRALWAVIEPHLNERRTYDR